MRFTIYTLDADDSKEWSTFRSELNIYKANWPQKFSYEFKPSSTIYMQGGTHIFSCVDPDCIRIITFDLNELMKRWPYYKLTTA